MTYDYRDYLADALELVQGWEIPDDELVETAIDQAKLMAGVSPDDLWDSLPCALL